MVRTKDEKGEVFSVHIMKAYNESRGKLHSFLTLALDRGEWLTSCPGHFIPGKEHRYLLNRNLMGFRVSLDVVVKGKISCLYWDSKPRPSSL
jgi:hypothetical protein